MAAQIASMLTRQSKNLHILLNTLGQYLQSHALPPISPTLPDMHSSTTAYITLQNLYKEQHRADLAEYRVILTSTLSGLGLPADAIPDDEIETFVKNSSAVAIVKGAPLRDSKEAMKGIQKVLSKLMHL